MKTCTECGIEKPPDAFYVKQIRKSGHATMDAKCKDCKNVAVAKRRAKRNGRDWKKRPEFVAKFCECGEEIKRRWMSDHSSDYCGDCKQANRYGMSKEGYLLAVEEHGGEWITAIEKARAKAIEKGAQRVEYRRDPWQMKFSAVVAGINSRVRQGKQKCQPVTLSEPQETPTSWGECLSIKYANLLSRSSSRRKRLNDPWYAKFDTTARNWRRKLRSSQHKRASRLTEKTT